MKVTKEFTFDSAHKLIDYDGPCSRLHGHTYKLQVTVEGKVDTSGMVIDFVILKKIVTKFVLSKLDHQYINDIISQPTAENMVLWIWDQLFESIQKENKEIRLSVIRLWETPNSFAEYSG